jgi:hypothetical protein
MKIFIFQHLDTIVYCTFYLTKINKYVLKNTIHAKQKYKHEQYEAFKQILKYVFLNAQQMFIQQVLHL